MDKVHVIVNPFSARGKTEARWTYIKDIFHYYFKEFKFIFTEKPMQATEIARELLHEGFDLIIGVGGDGTLNEITNGYFLPDSQQAINSDAAISIVPSGTGSDFVRYLKIPRDFKQSVQQIKNSSKRPLDVGRIRYGTETDTESRYFINVSDFGLGAEVVRALSEIPSGKRNAFSYYMGLLSTIRTYRSKKVRILLDDKEEIEGRYLIGAIANGRIFGGGMKIAPEAEPDDGFFDLVLVDHMNRLEIIRKSIYLYTGTITRQPKVTVRRARNIKVFSLDHQPVNIEYDGELGRCIPVEYQLIPKCLNFR